MPEDKKEDGAAPAAPAEPSATADVAPISSPAPAAPSHHREQSRSAAMASVSAHEQSLAEETAPALLTASFGSLLYEFAPGTRLFILSHQTGCVRALALASDAAVAHALRPPCAQSSVARCNWRRIMNVMRSIL
jgi:hypothetical protein